jgi:hypothetical protein
MKPTFILSLAFLLSASAFADTRAALQKIADEASVVNGSAEVSRYRKADLNIARLVRKNTRNRPTTKACVYENVVGIKTVISTMENLPSFNDIQDNAAEGLRRLAKAGKIAIIVARVMTDNIAGESFCDIYSFDVYTKDGYRLYLGYDFTD